MTTVPRPAATVVVLREEEPPSILMVQRSRGASFMAGAFVFPGGRVDDADGEATADDPLAAFRVAAVRELHEEAAVDVLPEALVPFARWVTPSAEPRRFDTIFFLTVVPAGTRARVDDAEVVALLWDSATDIFAKHAAGAINLAPPTLATIASLARETSLSAILRWASDRPLDAIQPRLVVDEDPAVGLAIVMPWDPRYADEPGDGSPIAAGSPLAEGPSRYFLRDGRFWT